MGSDSEDLSIKREEMLRLGTMIDKMSQIDHPNVAKIYEIFRMDNCLIIIQEDCAVGTLIGMLKTEKFIDEKLAIFITKQASEGVLELHKNGIVHGYINLDNIEIDSNGNWKISIKSLVLKAFYLSPEFKLHNVRGK